MEYKILLVASDNINDNNSYATTQITDAVLHVQTKYQRSARNC